MVNDCIGQCILVCLKGVMSDTWTTWQFQGLSSLDELLVSTEDWWQHCFLSFSGSTWHNSSRWWIMILLWRNHTAVKNINAAWPLLLTQVPLIHPSLTSNCWWRSLIMRRGRRKSCLHFRWSSQVLSYFIAKSSPETRLISRPMQWQKITDFSHIGWKSWMADEMSCKALKTLLEKDQSPRFHWVTV